VRLSLSPFPPALLCADTSSWCAGTQGKLSGTERGLSEVASRAIIVAVSALNVHHDLATAERRCGGHTVAWPQCIISAAVMCGLFGDHPEKENRLQLANKVWQMTVVGQPSVPIPHSALSEWQQLLFDMSSEYPWVLPREDGKAMDALDVKEWASTSGSAIACLPDKYVMSLVHAIVKWYAKTALNQLQRASTKLQKGMYDFLCRPAGPDHAIILGIDQDTTAWPIEADTEANKGLVMKLNQAQLSFLLSKAVIEFSPVSRQDSMGIPSSSNWNDWQPIQPDSQAADNRVVWGSGALVIKMLQLAESWPHVSRLFLGFDQTEGTFVDRARALFNQRARMIDAQGNVFEIEAIGPGAVATLMVTAIGCFLCGSIPSFSRYLEDPDKYTPSMNCRVVQLGSRAQLRALWKIYAKCLAEHRSTFFDLYACVAQALVCRDLCLGTQMRDQIEQVRIPDRNESDGEQQSLILDFGQGQGGTGGAAFKEPAEGSAGNTRGQGAGGASKKARVHGTAQKAGGKGNELESDSSSESEAEQGRGGSGMAGGPSAPQGGGGCAATGMRRRGTAPAGGTGRGVSSGAAGGQDNGRGGSGVARRRGGQNTGRGGSRGGAVSLSTRGRHATARRCPSSEAEEGVETSGGSDGESPEGRFSQAGEESNHQGGGSGYTTTASTPEGKGKGPGQRGGPTSSQAGEESNHQGGGSGYTTTASTPEGKGKGPGQRGGPPSGQAASSQHTSQVCVFLTDGKNGCVAPRGDALKVCEWCGNKFHMECMRFKFKVPYCIA